MNPRVVFEKEHPQKGYTIAYTEDGEHYTIEQKLRWDSQRVFVSKAELEQILKNEEVK